jgi:hypothetical protein
MPALLLPPPRQLRQQLPVRPCLLGDIALPCPPRQRERLQRPVPLMQEPLTRRARMPANGVRWLSTSAAAAASPWTRFPACNGRPSGECPSPRWYWRRPPRPPHAGVAAWRVAATAARAQGRLRTPSVAPTAWWGARAAAVPAWSGQPAAAARWAPLLAHRPHRHRLAGRWPCFVAVPPSYVQPPPLPQLTLILSCQRRWPRAPLLWRRLRLHRPATGNSWTGCGA